MAVSAERVILLDSQVRGTRGMLSAQPVLSSGVLDKQIRNDTPLPDNVTTHEEATEVQSIQVGAQERRSRPARCVALLIVQLAMFLFSVCHVVVVVQDSLPDAPFWKYALTFLFSTSLSLSLSLLYFSVLSNAVDCFCPLMSCTHR